MLGGNAVSVAAAMPVCAAPWMNLRREVVTVVMLRWVLKKSEPSLAVPVTAA